MNDQANDSQHRAKRVRIGGNEYIENSPTAAASPLRSSGTSGAVPLGDTSPSGIIEIKSALNTAMTALMKTPYAPYLCIPYVLELLCNPKTTDETQKILHSLAYHHKHLTQLKFSHFVSKAVFSSPVPIVPNTIARIANSS